MILLSDTRLTVPWQRGYKYLKHFFTNRRLSGCVNLCIIFSFRGKFGWDSTISSQLLFMNHYTLGIQYYAFEGFD